ncbi:hypothetical protein [Saccharobesus litoralis]|nr:hypothetical protein [Saccharobesus litoralis]
MSSLVVLANMIFLMTLYFANKALAQKDPLDQINIDHTHLFIDDFCIALNDIASINIQNQGATASLSIDKKGQLTPVFELSFDKRFIVKVQGFVIKHIPHADLRGEPLRLSSKLTRLVANY